MTRKFLHTQANATMGYVSAFLLSGGDPQTLHCNTIQVRAVPPVLESRTTAISFSCNNALDPFCLYSCIPRCPELAMPVTRLVFELSFSQSCRPFLCFITKLQ